MALVHRGARDEKVPGAGIRVSGLGFRVSKCLQI